MSKELPIFKQEFDHKNINGVDTYKASVFSSYDGKEYSYILEASIKDNIVEIKENGDVINYTTLSAFNKKYGSVDSYLKSKIDEYIDFNRDNLFPEGEEVEIIVGDDEDYSTENDDTSLHIHNAEVLLGLDTTTVIDFI